MIVQCPECRSRIRLLDHNPEDRMVKYLCNGCNRIVRIDLVQDEVKSSSSSGSFERTDARRRILVVDDKKTIREMAATMLQEAGYLVVQAEDGVEALERIQEVHPDLLLMDLLMPRMSGFDVLREIRKQDRLQDIQILVMSEVYKPNIMKFLQQVGVQGFLEKENLKDSLLFRVQSLLQQPAAS